MRTETRTDYARWPCEQCDHLVQVKAEITDTYDDDGDLIDTEAVPLEGESRLCEQCQEREEWHEWKDSVEDQIKDAADAGGWELSNEYGAMSSQSDYLTFRKDGTDEEEKYLDVRISDHARTSHEHEPKDFNIVKDSPESDSLEQVLSILKQGGKKRDITSPSYLKPRTPAGFHTREDGTLEPSPIFDGKPLKLKEPTMPTLAQTEHYRMTFPNLVKAGWSQMPGFVQASFRDARSFCLAHGGRLVTEGQKVIIADFPTLRSVREAAKFLQSECYVQADEIDITPIQAKEAMSDFPLPTQIEQVIETESQPTDTGAEAFVRKYLERGKAWFMALLERLKVMGETVLAQEIEDTLYLPMFAPVLAMRKTARQMYWVAVCQPRRGQLQVKVVDDPKKFHGTNIAGTTQSTDMFEVAKVWAGRLARENGLTEFEVDTQIEKSIESIAPAKTAVIRQEGDSWVLYSHDGKKRLGTHDSKADAERQERAIQSHKGSKMKKLSVWDEELGLPVLGMDYNEWQSDLPPDPDKDEYGAQELRLFIENDADLYHQQFMPIIRNIQRRLKNQTYNHALAPKLWMYLVENGAKKYAKEFGSPDQPWHKMFPQAVRQAVAQELADDYLEQIKGGEYDPLTPAPNMPEVKGTSQKPASIDPWAVPKQGADPMFEIPETDPSGAIHLHRDSEQEAKLSAYQWVAWAKAMYGNEPYQLEHNQPKQYFKVMFPGVEVKYWDYGPPTDLQNQMAQLGTLATSSQKVAQDKDAPSELSKPRGNWKGKKIDKAYQKKQIEDWSQRQEQEWAEFKKRKAKVVAVPPGRGSEFSSIELCPTCQGEGQIPGGRESGCPECGGTGMIKHIDFSEDEVLPKQGTLEELEAEPMDEPQEPEDGDLVIQSTGHLGGKTEVWEQGGKKVIEQTPDGYYEVQVGSDEFLFGEGNHFEDIDDAIKACMEQQQFWPNVWILDDHGGMTLTTVASKDVRASIDEVLPKRGGEETLPTVWGPDERDATIYYQTSFSPGLRRTETSPEEHPETEIHSIRLVDEDGQEIPLTEEDERKLEDEIRNHEENPPTREDMARGDY